LCFGLLGYFGGAAAARLVAEAGVEVAVGVAAALVVGYLLVRWRLARRRARPPALGEGDDRRPWLRHR
jgi:uncharacterized membrane protein YfcA